MSLVSHYQAQKRVKKKQASNRARLNEPVAAQLLMWTARQAAVQDICATSIHRHMPTYAWHLYKYMVTMSVHVLTFKWMYLSAHTHTTCSMNIFNLFTCGQSCGSRCHCQCPTCMFRCIHSFYVCDLTLGVFCGKYFSQDDDSGETLKQSFACSFDFKFFPRLQKPGDRNFTLSITNQLRGTFLKIHNICGLFFSLVWGGQGLFKHRLFS